MRLKLFLLVGAVGVVVIAAHKAYVTLTNLRPTSLSCADFAGGRSSASWVVLTDCELDLGNAIGLQSRILKIDKGLYIPVRPAGVAGPAPILLKTNDEDGSVGISPIGDASVSGPSGGDERALKIPATVSGLLQSGLDADRRSREALDKIARRGELRSDYVVIVAGEKPDLVEGIFSLAMLSFVPLIVFLFMRSKRIQAAKAAAAPVPPPLPPAPDPLAQ